MATQWRGAIPPPGGITPNYIDPPSQQTRNIALHTVCLTLVTLAVVMRVYTRVFVVRASFGIDDWFCILSYPFTVAFSSLMFKAFAGGIGRHMWDMPAEWIPATFKYFIFAQYTYLILMALVKLSLLFFYYRIFSSQNPSRHLIIFGIVFVVCTNTAMLVAVIFNCIPVARAWNAALPGHCMDPIVLPYISGALCSATDIYVLALPIYPVWHLNTRTSRKIRVSAVFGLGIFACAASLVRLGMTPVLKSNPDVTWNISTTSAWSTIEINISIICSCSMLLPAFLDRHWPKTLWPHLGRLWPSTANRSQMQNQYEDSSQSHQPSWLGQKATDGNSAEHHYFELGSTDHIYKTQNAGEPVSRHAFS